MSGRGLAVQGTEGASWHEEAVHARLGVGAHTVAAAGSGRKGSLRLNRPTLLAAKYLLLQTDPGGVMRYGGKRARSQRVATKRRAS